MKTAQEFLSGFTSRAEKLKGCPDIKTPSKLLAMMMIDFAELTDDQENNLFGACGGDLDVVKVRRAIKMVLKDSKDQKDDSNPPAYPTKGAPKGGHEGHKSKKFCRYCKKKGHVIEECWKLQSKNGRGNKNDGKSDSGSGGKWKFPVFVSNEAFVANPIVDSAAGTSLIGEDTLKEYCKILKINDLDTTDPMEKSHRFGYYGEPVKTICSVFVPLPIHGHDVSVRVDLLPGAHPFLLGAETQERMKAKLCYETKTLAFKLGSDKAVIKLIKPDKHYLIPLKSDAPSYITTVSKDEIDFKKLHINAGHASFENIKKLLDHAGLWAPTHADPIKAIISDCEACKTSGSPVSAPVVDINHVEPNFNEEVELDIVYFHGKPFLHMECKKTKLSSTIQLENREAVTLWNAFVHSWIFSTAHGPPAVLQGDPEFDNAVFKERAEKWGIALNATAAKAKWQQGIIERGDGVLRAIFNRIDKERPEVPLRMKVSHATFAKNIMFGTRKASSYELVYHKAFPIGGCSAALPESLRNAYSRSIAHRKIGVALKSRTRHYPSFKKSEYLYFFRKNFGGFVGPAKVVDINNGGNMKVIYQGKTFSVSKDMARKTHQPLEYWIDEQNPEEGSDEPSSEISQRSKNPAQDERLILKLKNYRPGDKEPEQVESFVPSPANPVEETRSGPSLGTRSRTDDDTAFGKLSFVTDLKVLYHDDGVASDELIKEAYNKKFQSWVEEEVFERVPKHSIPKESNVISSHVVYRWKDHNTPRERLKARIVPHGNKDLDRDLIRADSPSMKPEVLRLLCSFAADFGYQLKAMDVKTAFLQTGKLEREVYVVPPKEANETEYLWRLLKTVYGLVDGPIMWYKHSRKSMLEFGLTPSLIDPTVYFLRGAKGEPHRLVVATQVDDFLYAGRKEDMKRFEEFIQSKYTIGHVSSGSFTFNGVNIKFDDKDQCFVLSQPGAKDIDKIVLGKTRSKDVESNASTLERNHYRSITGSLLWCETQSVPHLLYLTSSMARKTPCLQVKHLKKANSSVKYGRTLDSSIRIFKTDYNRMKLLTFTDASHGTDGGVFSQEGSITFKYEEKSGFLVPILWSSRKIKRVVKSTLAAETIAAVNGYDDAVYTQYLLKEFYQRKVSLNLYLDSKSLFDLLSSTHLVETTEKRLKIDISIIRQAYENGELSSVTWIPRQIQLADSLTKDNREAAELLQKTLNEGHLLVDLTQGITRTSA